MIKTKFLELFGTKYPIVQAGMGPYNTTKLSAAVANAGGLGLISTVGMGTFELPGLGTFNYSAIFGTGTPDELLGQAIDYVLQETKQYPEAKFGVNIPVSEEFIPTATTLITYLVNRIKKDEEVKKKLVAIFTSAGDPLPWAKDSGNKKKILAIKEELPSIRWVHVVPSVKAAKRCEKAGVDAIVASGREGGAHCSWRDTSSMVLIPEVIKSVSVPVIAAGGFCDGQSLAAALAFGAIGVQMGTRFIATQESDFDPGWKNHIVRCTEEDSLVARGFFGPMRFLKNNVAMKLVDETIKGASDLYKGNPCGSTAEILELEIGGMKHLYKGEIDDAPLLGGQVAGRIHEIPKVKDLIEKIMEEAETIVKNMSKFIA